jgi:hypothetical protein
MTGVVCSTRVKINPLARSVTGISLYLARVIFYNSNGYRGVTDRFIHNEAHKSPLH